MQTHRKYENNEFLMPRQRQFATGNGNRKAFLTFDMLPHLSRRHFFSEEKKNVWFCNNAIKVQRHIEKKLLNIFPMVCWTMVKFQA